MGQYVALDQGPSWQDRIVEFMKAEQAKKQTEQAQQMAYLASLPPEQRQAAMQGLDPQVQKRGAYLAQDLPKTPQQELEQQQRDLLSRQIGSKQSMMDGGEAQQLPPTGLPQQAPSMPPPQEGPPTMMGMPLTGAQMEMPGGGGPVSAPQPQPSPQAKPRNQAMELDAKLQKMIASDAIKDPATLKLWYENLARTMLPPEEQQVALQRGNDVIASANQELTSDTAVKTQGMQDTAAGQRQAATEAGAMSRLRVSEAGATTREGMQQAGADRRAKEETGGRFTVMTDQNGVVTGAWNPTTKIFEPPPKEGMLKGGLSSSEQTRRGSIDLIVNSIGNLELLAENNKDSIGQVKGRLAGAKEFVGAASTEVVQMRQIAGNLKDLLLRARSGAAISEKEAERLAKLVPSVNEEYATFSAKLQQFKRDMERYQGMTTPAKAGADRLAGADSQAGPSSGGNVQVQKNKTTGAVRHRVGSGPWIEGPP